MENSQSYGASAPFSMRFDLPVYISIQQDRIVRGGNNQKETKDWNADQERHLSLTVTESVLITYGHIIGEHKYFDQAAVYLIE